MEFGKKITGWIAALSKKKKSLRSKEHRVAADDYGRDNASSQIDEMEVFFIQSNLQASCGWVLAKELVCKSSIICWY